ncbi:Ger(x)C family spore germination protein [Cytobacillus gottheilii]|uniref:Ger(x)C family spore germination protein n=1 Tax=Cytobacillus gottheilii TaxID=859144 RepID=UPI0009B97513|nr:Ger(x)C family spore germination protein [Cytobacillus gottheilii]
MKIVRVFIFCALLLLLAGCVEPEIIDDVNIIVGAGFDKIEKDRFIGTYLVQDYLPDQSIKNITYISESTLRRSVLSDAQKQSSEPLVTGGIRIVVFEENFAENGIIDFIDAFQRDATVGSRIFLTTSSGSAQELLKGEYGSRGNGNYLYNLLSHNINERDIPKSNLHLFLHDFYQEGKDVYLPQLHQKSKKQVEISGMTIFKDDSAVDFIEKDDMFYFKLLVDKYSSGYFNVDLSKDNEASVHSINSKHHFKIDDSDRDKLTIHINVTGIVKEFTGDKLTKQIVKEIEKAVNDKIERECSKLVQRFQEKGTDPIGIGKYYRTQTRGFDLKKFKDNYANLDIRIKADVTIEETGVID